MRSRLLRLWSLGLLAIVGAAADTSCVDCEATLVANSDWSNGVLAEGNYYQPTKTGNWLLGRSSGGEGPLELRNDPTNGHYVWNFCPKGHSGYCRVYLAQVITVQAGVTYDFSFQYAMDGVRASANTIEMTVATLPQRTTVFNQFTYSGNTNGWATFNTNTWTPTASGDIVLTLTWRNDPNDATVKIKSAAMSAVECRNPESTKTCSAEPEPVTTTTVSTSSPDPEPTTTSTEETTTSAEPEPTTTTTTEEATTSADPEPTVTATETMSTTSPTKGCGIGTQVLLGVRPTPEMSRNSSHAANQGAN
ncbi:predicted protein [Chaetomium globosum CBS 148.51]|uniref:CBM-cenC domain-containing protein n=1 Tax=Chaetomium globosum (strain ATCC 6205 / CBS 148.51 / DSM 1962 / NBRC 6347 / NRRL 1970) TaxID=306901 RepID=Q2GRS7_CHAGB|nr:uncharacterized protein CHGG_09327 [Chaetomium globosum CBS 148.51]EAQ85313.1 predicted protein [Chaetomium globosum CBS 148.51]